MTPQEIVQQNAAAQAQGANAVPLKPFIQRLQESAAYLIAGVTPSTWFGPFQPLKPMAPEDVKGRNWDYQVGWNLTGGPRTAGAGGVTFYDLRSLADNCDILRLVIETRKDQIAAQQFVVRVKQPTAIGIRRHKPTPEQQKNIDALTAFFNEPMPGVQFMDWIRILAEDMMVIDAVSIYARPNIGGGVHSLELIDGATIKPLIDQYGRTPLAPDPAFQQWLHGVPATDYTTDEMYYCPRNRSTSKVYGKPPVEQIIITVNTAIRRSLFNLEYYREGSQPDAIIGLPKEWTTQAIKDFQKWWDEVLSGNSAQRRKVRAVPGDFKYQETKAPPMKDDYDEWLTRVICYAFSVPPTPFVKMMNRAVAESVHDAALDEGLTPILLWIAGILNMIIARKFGVVDVEFAWQDDREQNPKDQADIDKTLTAAGIISIDEAREGRGLDPLGGAASKPMVLTATGYVSLDAGLVAATAVVDPLAPATAGEKAPIDPLKADHPAHDPELKAIDNVDAAGTNDPKLDAADAASMDTSGIDAMEEADTAAADKVTHVQLKLYKLAAHPKMKGKKTVKPAKASAATVAKSREAIASKLKAVFGSTAKAVAAGMKSGHTAKLMKAGPEDVDLTGLKVVVASTAEDLEDVYGEANTEALASIGVSIADDLTGQINTASASWAKQNAADLVTDIDQSTRDMLRDTISAGLEQGLSQEEIAENISSLNANVFSDERAELIARNEVGNANSEGALDGYKAASDMGINVQKAWLADDSACEICIANEDAGPIDLDDSFPSGDDAPLAHPNCECALTSVVADETVDAGE